MSFSHTAANIVPNGLDWVSPVRWELQDTDASEAAVQDEEIAALIAATSVELSRQLRVLLVAHHLAEKLWRKYARQASFAKRGLSLQLTERAKSWKLVVDDMQAKLDQAVAAANGSTGDVLYASRPSQYVEERYGY